MDGVSRSVVAAAVAAVLFPAMSSSGPPKPPKPPAIPVDVEIESPAYKADKPLGVMYTSGTTLEFKAIINAQLGILSHSNYVPKDGIGYVIFADPDSCLEVGVNFGLPLALQPPCIQARHPGVDPNFENFPDPAKVIPDETYLQFRVDNDAAGVEDFWPSPRLADPLQSGEPVFRGLTRHLVGDPTAGTPQPQVELEVGPTTGGTTNDGFGYGADDDFTGLVVLSNRGVGIVYEDADGWEGTRLANFTPVAQRTLRNLAGFLESVSYELKSNNGKTIIHAHMVLPDGLIAPIIAVDNCRNVDPNVPSAECDDTGVFKVDGGALLPGGGTGLEHWTALIPTLTYEVRAFVVSGAAPTTLADLNNDNNVTAADAKLAGYNVISDEAVTRFRQFPSNLCNEQGSLSTVFGVDVDGNGFSAVHSECPPGPGSLKGIP